MKQNDENATYHYEFREEQPFVQYVTHPYCTQRHYGQYKYNKEPYRGDHPINQRYRDTVEVISPLAVYAIGDIVHEEGPVPEKEKGSQQY